MDIKVYYCENGDYSKNTIDAILEYQVLTLGDTKLEVELETSPQVYGQGKGINNVNLMLKDQNDSIAEDERKYFINASWSQRQRILWMFKKHRFQKLNIWGVILAPIIVSLIVFYFTQRSYDEVEFSYVNVNSGLVRDTFDLRIRNIGTRSVVLNSIEFDFIQSWKLIGDSNPQLDFLEPSNILHLKGIKKAILGSNNINSSIEVKTSNKINANNVERILITFDNLELSEIALFKITLHLNKNDEVESEEYLHVFTQNNLDNYCYYKNNKLISYELIKQYHELDQGSFSDIQKDSLNQEIKRISKPLKPKFRGNKQRMKKAIESDPKLTDKAKKLFKRFNII